jgi:hypothetical protein
VALVYSNRVENVIGRVVPQGTYRGVCVDEALGVAQTGVVDLLVEKGGSRITFDTNYRKKGPVPKLVTRPLRGTIEVTSTVSGRGLRQDISLLPGQKLHIDGNTFNQLKE